MMEKSINRKSKNNPKKALLTVFAFFVLVIAAYADGWVSPEPYHQTLYADTITSRNDASSVSVADAQGLFVTGDVKTLGNVGIGTLTPAQSLDVVGQIHSTGDICTDAAGGKCLSAVSGEIEAGQVWNSSGANIFNTNSGNVGIGTASPTSGRLVIDGGHLTFGTDNLYDIGTNGASRPRNIYVGNSFLAPDQPAVGYSFAGAATTGIKRLTTGNTGLGITVNGNDRAVFQNTPGQANGLKLFSTLELGQQDSIAWATINPEGIGTLSAYRAGDSGTPSNAALTFNIYSYRDGTGGLALPASYSRLSIKALASGPISFVSESAGTGTAKDFSFTGGNVGIGTANPGAALEVAGQVKITGGTPGAGKVLTSDAEGLATWVAPVSGLGGSGSATQVSFFTGGTSIGGDSNLYWDNNNKRLGIGTASPSTPLHVTGQITSGVSTGTAPLVVASTTKVANLNADLLDGMDSSSFGDATAGNQQTIMGRIGTSSDGAGTGTLFAHASRIYNQVDNSYSACYMSQQEGCSNAPTCIGGWTEVTSRTSQFTLTGAGCGGPFWVQWRACCLPR